jgi:hypothetical protein
VLICEGMSCQAQAPRPSVIYLRGFGSVAVAKNTVLRCRGHQVGDWHSLPDQFITLDMQNNTVVSIQLGAANAKDVINAPVKVSKDELQWSYEAVSKKYVFNRQTSRLRLLSNTLELVGLFECSAS